MDVVVPAGEIGEVIDVDPDDTTQIMVQVFRYVHGLRFWRNMIPATAGDVQLIAAQI